MLAVAKAHEARAESTPCRSTNCAPLAGSGGRDLTAVNAPRTCTARTDRAEAIPVATTLNWRRFGAVRDSCRAHRWLSDMLGGLRSAEPGSLLRAGVRTRVGLGIRTWLRRADRFRAGLPAVVLDDDHVKFAEADIDRRAVGLGQPRPPRPRFSESRSTALALVPPVSASAAATALSASGPLYVGVTAVSPLASATPVASPLVSTATPTMAPIVRFLIARPPSFSVISSAPEPDLQARRACVDAIARTV